MIVKIKDGKLVPMGEYCYPTYVERYMPKYENCIMPDGTPNDEQVLVGYELNKKCEFSNDCKGCYKAILPKDFNGELNDYVYNLEGDSVRLLDFTDEAKKKQIHYEIQSLEEKLRGTDYVFVKLAEYQMVGEVSEQYDLQALHEEREQIRQKINDKREALKLLLEGNYGQR